MIRAYEPSDLAMLQAWCSAHGAEVPTEQTFPGTTYIYVQDDLPIMSLSLIVTNALDHAYAKYPIANPAVSKERRSGVLKKLFAYIGALAFQMGFKHLVLFAPDEKRLKLYESCGFSPTIPNLTMMAKELN